jgi:hypothetical protein
MSSRSRKKKQRQPSGSNDDSLPEVATWLPRKQDTGTLSAAFSRRCALGEEHLLRQLAHEREMSMDSFDSGLSFEAAVREELGRLLPRRYTSTGGTLVDRRGFSAGQCDIVVFNSLWFSVVNAPTLIAPARLLIPVEGAYAVGEVKQSLHRNSLDEAMEKLVTCHRLHRPSTFANRLVENRESDGCTHGLTNPLFSFVIAGRADPADFQSLIGRFYDINKKLKRVEVVRFLCVLGAGAVGWAYVDPVHKDIRHTLFMRADLFEPIFPAFCRADKKSPLFSLVQALQRHLYHSVLGPEDLATAYGAVEEDDYAGPTDHSIMLPPDPEWLERLSHPCKDKYHED